MMKKLMLILSCLFFSVGLIYSQTTTVSGVVVDDAGMEVVGASVVVKGSTTGVATDIDGKFSINVPENSTLVFSLVGMKKKEVKATANMKVVLEGDSYLIDEVMVVAYGVAEKKSFTGSASVVKSDDINKRVVANISKAVDGLVAGVMTTSGSGQPGESAKIVVRGQGSINASNDPLYVIDGIPFMGNISSLNPNDIESMTVLKDASAGALYGARGANGVIIITTKSGKSGEVQVNLKANWGIGSRALPRYKTVNEKQYLETVFQSFKNLALDNDYTEVDAAAYALRTMASNTQGVLGVNQQYNPYNYPIAELIDPVTGLVRDDATLRYSYDWLDEVTADSPLRQEYVIDVAGGTKDTRYLFSFGYLNEEGLLKTTAFERYTGRVKVDSDIKPWFKAGFSSNFSLGTSNSSNTASSASSNLFYSALNMAPIYPIYQLDADAKPMYDSKGNILYDFGARRGAGASQGFNAIATLFKDKYETNRDNFGARGFVTLGDLESGPLRGLKLDVTLGGDVTDIRQSTHYNPNFGNSIAVKGSTTKVNSRRFSFNFNQLLSWKREFDSHKIDIMIGHEYFADKYNYMYADKTGYPFEGLTELGPAINTRTLRSKEDNYRVQSVLSRFNYGYADRYYLSASLRRDGSSVFEKDGRWGTFWSVGGNWRVSEEQFVKNMKLGWLDNLATKVSYGVQGNDYLLQETNDAYGDRNRNYYAWQMLYNTNYPNASAGGVVLDQLENKEITWEKNSNLNIGLEGRVFDRLSFIAEYYNKKTTDLLLFYPMALSTGFEGYWDNAGSMRSQGFEITLSGDIIKTTDIGWNMTLMGNTVSNKVLSLTAESNKIESGTTIIQVGEVLRSFYTSVSAGVDPETGRQLYKVWDLDADGNRVNVRTSDSRSEATNSKEVTGSRQPDLFGSVNNQFRYKDFDLGFLMTYSFGGKVLDGVYWNLYSGSYVGQNRPEKIVNAWKKPGDITDVPRVAFYEQRNITDADLVSATYFAIKNITFGYTLPKHLTQKAFLKSVRFNITADNVAMFSKLDGMNPQNTFGGTTTSQYTPMRTVSLGVDIKF